MERVLINCPFCPCAFLTRKDLFYHIRKYGRDSTKHLRMYEDEIRQNKSQYGYRRKK